jgi:hypothetical protein
MRVGDGPVPRRIFQEGLPLIKHTHILLPSFVDSKDPFGDLTADFA